jgi:hypothetical protein
MSGRLTLDIEYPKRNSLAKHREFSDGRTWALPLTPIRPDIKIGPQQHSDAVIESIDFFVKAEP